MDPQTQQLLAALAGQQSGQGPTNSDPLNNGQNASWGQPATNTQTTSLGTPQDAQTQMLQALMQPPPPTSAAPNFWSA